jgi:lantibiotic modifying enzyme
MEDIKEVKAYIEKGVEKIKNIGVKHDNNRLAYCMISNPNDTDSYAPNISLAHGMSSILILLTKIYKLGISENKVKELMKSISLYIVDQRNFNFNKIGSYFPSQSLEYNVDNLKSRMAWCYGDLGIANALYIYGDTIHNNDIIELSIEIVEFSTKRTEQEDTYVMDSGICHGTSGISYIFKRFYERTKIESFEKSSKYWLDKTIMYATHIDGFAGYKTYRPEEYGGWLNSYGLLDGVSGNGIVLLSNFCDSSKWDECFLLR